jgi:hypothetical protein
MKSKISTTRSILNQPKWQLDSSYSIDNHFDIIELNAVNDKQSVADVVGRVFAERFDFDEKPCWNATFITNIQGDTINGNISRYSALFIMCHHSLGDGQAFVRGLLKFVSSVSSNGKVNEEALSRLQYSAGMNSKKNTKPASLASNIQHVILQIFLFIYGTIPLSLTDHRNIDRTCNSHQTPHETA